MKLWKKGVKSGTLRKSLARSKEKGGTAYGRDEALYSKRTNFLRKTRRTNMTYKPSGVCSRAIDFEVENDRVKNVRFYGGCNGNSQGVSRLVEGMLIDEVISRLEGVKCGFKNTSCPDQLARALKEWKTENHHSE